MASIAKPDLGFYYYGDAFVYFTIGNRESDAIGYYVRFSTDPSSFQTDEDSLFVIETGDVTEDLEIIGAFTVDLNEDNPIFSGDVNKSGHVLYQDSDTLSTGATPRLEFQGNDNGEETFYFQARTITRSENENSASTYEVSEWSDIRFVTLHDPINDFEAHAISPYIIRVNLPPLGGDASYSILRKRADSGPSGAWDEIVSDYTLTDPNHPYFDDLFDASENAGNILFEYKLRLTTTVDNVEVSVQSDNKREIAWLTHTRYYSIETFEFASTGVFQEEQIEVKIPDIVALEYLGYSIAATESLGYEVVATEYFGYQIVATEVLRYEVVAMEVPLPFNGKYGGVDSMGNITIQRGQTPTFLARILNAEMSVEEGETPAYVPIDRDDVHHLKYRIVKKGLYYGSSDSLVAGFEDVTVALDNENSFSFCLQEELVDQDPVWIKNVDSIGYNFKFTPEVQYDGGNALLPFPEVGTYEVLFELHMKAGKGNPICWQRTVNVT